LQAALAHSLPLKKAELGVRCLSIWGRINTCNGRDYIVAQTTPNPHLEDGKAVVRTLYFVSQDGISWSDLPEVENSQRETAQNMRNMLQGDLTKKFYWPPKSEDEENVGTS
jgi:hypothetical protein